MSISLPPLHELMGIHKIHIRARKLSLPLSDHVAWVAEMLGFFLRSSDSPAHQLWAGNRYPPPIFFFFYSVDMVIHASTVRSDPSGLTSPCSSTCSGGSSPHVLPHKPPSPILTLPALQNPLTRQTHVPGSPFSVGSPSRTTRAAIQTCLGESTELRTKRFL